MTCEKFFQQAASWNIYYNNEEVKKYYKTICGNAESCVIMGHALKKLYCREPDPLTLRRRHLLLQLIFFYIFSAQNFDWKSTRILTLFDKKFQSLWKPQV